MAIMVAVIIMSGGLIVSAPGAMAIGQSGDFQYQLVNGNACVTDYTGTSKTVAIPSTLDGHPVTAIDDNAFSGDNITSVTIPNSVTLIGNYSFAGCTDLTSVSLGSGLIDIEKSAFQNCQSLTSVSIPDSVKFIGDSSFLLCTSLTSINVGAANPSYASVNGVLYDKAITMLIQYPGGKAGAYVMPASVVVAQEGAFFGCKGITAITISDNVFGLGDMPFMQCGSLTQINVGSGNAFYSSANGVLYNKAMDVLVSYPGGKGGAFTVPNSVKTISEYSFSTSLVSSIVMGGSVKTISDYAFAQCMNLTSVTIGYGVTSIGSSAFTYCVNLTSLDLGSNVQIIGSGAFGACLSLKSVTIPNSVTTIERAAFFYCRSLTSVVIGSGVTTIKDDAFSSCISLRSMTIPKSVTSIEAEAFSTCFSLTAFNVASDNPNYASVDGVLYDKGLDALLAFPGGRTGTFDVPDSVTTIGFGAFYGSNITAVNIGNGVTKIQNYAFVWCQNMTSVSMGMNLTEIGYSAFAHCQSLSSVTFSKCLKTIREAAFEDCTNLTFVIIPAEVTTIEHAAFYDCTNLTSIYFLGLGAPTTVGYNWIGCTADELTGHAYAASNFPSAGSKFNDLLMGDVIPIVPGAPTDVTIEVDNGTIVLSWNSPLLNGSSDVASYKVYRASALNGTYELVATVNSSIYNDVNVESGQGYWYKVTAVNSNGEGVSSPVVNESIASLSSSSGKDNTMLLVGIVAIIAITIAAVVVLMKKRKK